MVIRQEQVETFAPAIERAFALRLAEYIKSRHGQSVIRLGEAISLVKSVPKDGLNGLVLNGIQRAKKHGLDTESSQAGFVVLMFEIAPNFDEYPAAQRILDDTSIAVENRLEQLAQRMSPSDWGTMNRGYDHNAWTVPQADKQP